MYLTHTPAAPGAVPVARAEPGGGARAAGGQAGGATGGLTALWGLTALQDLMLEEAHSRGVRMDLCFSIL